jgi:hypothetical protein
VDELWQRYRTFWTPILWGLGVFLVGLIVVHVLTGDPEQGAQENDTKASAIKHKKAPTARQTAALRDAALPLRKRVADFGKRLDQRHGQEGDVAKSAVTQALVAAIARGRLPADPAAFDGDAAAASAATALCQQRIDERIAQLGSQDPNVSFSRLQADVVQELAVRANRADVDVNAEEFGLAAVTSVDRSDLPRRLENLALIATVVDVAIREGVRSIDAIAILPSGVRLESQGADPFLQEWPVKIDLTGPPEALGQILDVLTDGERPIVMGDSVWKASDKKNGLVKAELKVESVRIRVDAPLGLDNEGGEGS